MQSLTRPFQGHRDLVRRNATDKAKFSTLILDTSVSTAAGSAITADSSVIPASTLPVPATPAPTPAGPAYSTSVPPTTPINNTPGTSAPATSGPSASDKPTVSPPSRSEIMKYRQHYGTNLGSCFVLEKWLTPFAFPRDATSDQTSELACVSLSVKEIGPDATRLNFENRWSNFVHESDFDYLVNQANCERLLGRYDC
jgi:hypothetical protein